MDTHGHSAPRTSPPTTPAAPTTRIAVAGHVCLDIIPELPPDPDGRALQPGELDVIGPALLAVGGCVGNTGIALHRLGALTTLVARVGDDVAGEALVRLIHEAVPAGASNLLQVRGAATSYSVVLNRPGLDRAIAHHPGVNDTFVADDVPDELLASSALLHVGYPPLMAAMVADGGRELERLLVRAHGHGVVTSLDLANATFGPGAQRIAWPTLLARVLPHVDVFLPSLDEAAHLLGREVLHDAAYGPAMTSVARLARDLLDLGVAVAGLKLGEHGLYVHSADTSRIAAVPRLLGSHWVARELASTVFETHVAGTTGAGDSTIAGFLFGLLSGMAPEDTLTAACAVGGASTEAPDGTSAVPAWAELAARLDRGWRRRERPPGEGWQPAKGGVLNADRGLWRGPDDLAGPA